MEEKTKSLRNIPIAIPSIGEEELKGVKETLTSGWLTQGPKVQKFEQDFATLHNVNHALAVTSCTTALHLALVAIGIKPGDEVIVPAFTWIATANVVLYCGATPVFCDVEKDTFNIDVKEIAKKITDNTKAIIPVHLFGLCANIDAIKKIIPPHVKIIEDAACAAGAIYKDRYAGTLGDMAAFSFHPRKSITTGEGGMLTTNDSHFYKLALMMRNHGAEIPEEVRHSSPKPYLLPDFKILGFNYRMTDLQAAVGIAQLAKLTAFIIERDTWAKYYQEHLKDLAWLKPQSIPKYQSQHAWQSFVCYIEPNIAPLPRNNIMEILQAKGIASRPGTHAIHTLSFYKEKFYFRDKDFPIANDCANNTIALPLHNAMTKDDYDYIIRELRAIA